MVVIQIPLHSSHHLTDIRSRAPLHATDTQLSGHPVRARSRPVVLGGRDRLGLTTHPVPRRVRKLSVNFLPFSDSHNLLRRRYDHDYLERLIFHVLGIGGPCDDRYIPPETLEKITELWEIWLVTYAEWKEDARENWERRKEAFRARLASVAGWIATKAGWPTALCLRHENEDEEEGDEPDLESGEPIIGESLCKSPQSATARQPLLQNARLYGAISSQGPEGVPDTLVQPDLSLISTSPGGKAPSALPGSQGLFRSWSKKSRRRSVRFHEVHNIVMYKHVDWEQLGRTQVSRHRRPKLCIVRLLKLTLLPS